MNTKEKNLKFECKNRRKQKMRKNRFDEKSFFSLKIGRCRPYFARTVWENAVVPVIVFDTFGSSLRAEKTGF